MIERDLIELDERFTHAFRFISSSLSRAYNYMAEDKKDFHKAIALALTAAVILTFVPFLVGNLIDSILMEWMAGSEEAEFILDMSSAIVLFMLVWYAMNVHATKKMILLGMRITKRMRADINRKVLSVQMSYIDTHPAGEMTALISNDMTYVYRMLSSDLIGCIVFILTSAIITVMMLITNIWLGLLFVLLIPVSILVAQKVGKRSAKDFIREKKAVGELNGEVVDTLNNYRLVKTFNLEKELESKYEGINEEHRISFTRSRSISGLIEPSVMVISNIGYVIAAAMGAVFLMNGTLSAGLFVAFIFYVRAISKPMISSTTAINVIQAEMASLNRILDLIEEEEISDDSDSEPLDVPSVKGELSMEKVCFSYSEGTEVLHDVSLMFPSDRITAIIGHTGSGKSTMTNLMLRFYDPDSGRITLDGRDLSTISRKDIASVCSPILQTQWIFNGTIRENICFGKEYPLDEIVRMSEITGLASRVERMRDGYDTVIGDNGYIISLVDMKLIALTRVLLSDPKVIIMDEATSGLDPRSELQIMGSMRDMMRGRTVIMTTHNLRLASKADRIILMDSGRVLEQGTHEELMAKGGRYSELYLMSI